MGFRGEKKGKKKRLSIIKPWLIKYKKITEKAQPCFLDADPTFDELSSNDQV